MEYKQVFKPPEYYAKYKIAEFLLEDIPEGDKTTKAIIDSKKETTAVVQAEKDLILAGDAVFNYFFDDTFNCALNYQDGQEVPKGKAIGFISGKAGLILSRERTLLNLLQRLCGIATMTRKFVDIAKPYNVKILDTRKTTPGLRLFEKYAVTVGGGTNHRLDLSSGVLIKDNHIKFAGGIEEAVNRMRSANEENLEIEVEVENLEQVKEALGAGADGLLLDNMSPETAKEAVEYIRATDGGDKVFVEASGGIDLDNLQEYAKTGVDAISSGALTHSVKSAEIHLELL